MTARTRVEVNDVNSAKPTITMPHWGITMRTLFGAALAAWPDAKPGEGRDFSVQYKGREIGTVHVKQLQETTPN